MVVSLSGVGQISVSESQQKSLCLMTGVGCGSGHVLLPALGRF